MAPVPTTTDLTYRAATTADIDAILALVTGAYRGETSRAGWSTEADFLDGPRTDSRAIAEILAQLRSRVILAHDPGGQLLACAHVADEDGAGYFGMFAVVPGLQNGGIGKRVLAEAERTVRDDFGLSTLTMTVIDIRSELIAFYERRGYVRTGATKPFPYGDERFGIPRRTDLRFAVLAKTLAQT